MMADEQRYQRQQHWEQVYESRAEQQLSWFQPKPALSLRLIRSAGLKKQDAIIDIGGGTSTLVDLLLQAGYTNLSVLDIAEKALRLSQQRLAQRAAAVNWIRADITAGLGNESYILWHDRAVFHFLTNPLDRDCYLAVLHAALLPGGFVIIATFSPQGPDECSGLPVQRYSTQMLSDLLGAEFQLLKQQVEVHQTPAGKRQDFIYCLFQRSLK
ncbi:MAG: class I SAM-dependent methyltransferase [Chromatiales bacterium]